MCDKLDKSLLKYYIVYTHYTQYNRGLLGIRVTKIHVTVTNFPVSGVLYIINILTHFVYHCIMHLIQQYNNVQYTTKRSL